MANKGQSIFIVGGSSGIGLATACQLASQGANVAIFARREDVLNRARLEILDHQSDESAKIVAFPLDASDFSQTEDAFGKAVTELGAPSILINSAGGATPQRFVDMQVDQLDKTFRSNVTTCWNSCKAILPHMQAQGFGTLVNVSSLAGLLGIYGYTDYCLTKFGVIGFSEALRSELKPEGIKVQVFCPPDTQTPGFEEENKTKPIETAALSAGAKLMTANDVARALVKGVATNRFIVLANRESKVIWALQRFAPGLGRIYVDGIVTKAQKK